MRKGRLVARLRILVVMVVACRRQPTVVPPAIRYDAHVSAGGALPAAGGMTNPFRGDQPSAKEGEGIFVAMNCDGCHGGVAVGWVRPRLVDGSWRNGRQKDSTLHPIVYGRT